MKPVSTSNKVRALLREPNAIIMGILNVTPDSFSDGGGFAAPQSALRRALTMAENGADIIDIGGESTRPGAKPVPSQEELDRVIPIIEEIVNATDTPVSIDTNKADVMAEAVAAGAQMINDINALQAPGALQGAVQAGVPICIMHMQGQPQNMQSKPDYQEVVSEVVAFLSERKRCCVELGIDANDLVVDPGIGFGKALKHNLLLLASVDIIKQHLGCEVLVGVSRKSLIDKLLSRPVDARLPASLGLAVQSVLKGTKILRVHDVRATYDAVRSAEAVLQANSQND